jgi:UDP-N-acetylmuramoyl-L-alanyl-D-glutamate--2,6-diaminopimelate ligase
MDLREVIGDAAAGAPPVEVVALAYDNRAVEPGTLFFCVPGFTRDGHEFAADAAARGAVALVVERPVEGVDLPQVRVDDVRAAMAPAAARLFGDPTAALQVVGVTGTNGKTTTAYLLRALLEAAGHRTGLLGTVTSVIGGREEPTIRTTPEGIDLQRTFRAMLDAGDTHCAMEVSSHALDLHRADAIHWAVAMFTNLTQDHLDFHEDMEAYFLAKRRLFEQAEGELIVNVDDPYGVRLAADFPRATTIAIDAPAVRRAPPVRVGLTGSEFTVDGVRMRAPLPGRFNVLNALGAVAAVRALGVDDATIAAALPNAGRVPGRFEPVDEGQGFAVLVDYAHPPDSLDNVLAAARSLAPARGSRVIVGFGAGGDRDRGKRPQMGAIAARLADVVVVTSDNPRSEDPEAIIAEILGGIERDDVEAIPDRRAAIERAIGLAADGDVVVIAGKGHEQGQEFADGVKVPFDDATVAREALRARLVA